MLKDRVTRNQLTVVFAGTLFWSLVMQILVPGFTNGHALMLAVWIGMGSPFFVRSFVDFQRPVRPLIFVGLMLLSIGWPITYAQTRRKK